MKLFEPAPASIENAGFIVARGVKQWKGYPLCTIGFFPPYPWFFSKYFAQCFRTRSKIRFSSSYTSHMMIRKCCPESKLPNAISEPQRARIAHISSNSAPQKPCRHFHTRHKTTGGNKLLFRGRWRIYTCVSHLHSLDLDRCSESRCRLCPVRPLLYRSEPPNLKSGCTHPALRTHARPVIV